MRTWWEFASLAFVMWTIFEFYKRCLAPKQATPKFSIQLNLKKAELKRGKKKKKRVKRHLYNKSIDKIKPQIDKTKTNRTILKEWTYIVSEEIFKWIMKIIGNATVSLLYICLMANLQDSVYRQCNYR